MLSKPKYGWTTVKIRDNFTVRASYLTNLPIDWLRSCIYGLKYKVPTVFYIDTEGEEIYITSDIGGTIIDSFDFTKDRIRIEDYTLKDFANDLLTDIYEYFDCWVFWEPYPLINQKENLFELIESLEEILESYE